MMEQGELDSMVIGSWRGDAWEVGKGEGTKELVLG